MNPFLLVEALIDKGYELDEVISNLSHTQVNAQKLDMRSKGLEAHYDASGHYIPPAQVVLAAFTMCDDPRDCAAALMEFNLYSVSYTHLTLPTSDLV